MVYSVRAGGFILFNGFVDTRYNWLYVLFGAVYFLSNQFLNNMKAFNDVAIINQMRYGRINIDFSFNSGQ